MPTLPFTRRQALLGAAALAIGLLLAGKLLLGARAAAPPQPVPVAVEPASAPPAPTEARIVAHVVGAVRRPGLYRLPSGSRIADAVARAGGATGKADLEHLNLAAPLADGVQVVVPHRGAAGEAPAGAGAGAPASTGPLHLNSATLEQLDALPGVGPVTAQRILDYREQHGPFASVDELDAVPGIGPARLEQLRELVEP